MFASFVRGDAPLPDPVSWSSPFAVVPASRVALPFVGREEDSYGDMAGTAALLVHEAIAVAVVIWPIVSEIEKGRYAP